MANTSKLLETVKTINDSLNKIADDFNPVDALVVLEHISNICDSIAKSLSYVTEYRVNNEGIQCAIKIINPDSKDPLLKKLTDYIGKFGDDENPTTIKPIKLDSDEANTLDAMIGDIADRVNSIDNEVEAIKEHLTEHGLGIDNTFNCDEILKRLNEKNEAAKKTEFKDIYPWPAFECGVEEETPSLEQINDMCAKIENICKRLDSTDRFNIEMCAALLRSNKKFRKAFTKNITKVKAVKHNDTDKLVPDKEITTSEE